MHPYLDIGIRAFLSFAVLMLVIRFQGKKQIAQFTYFNYVNGIVIGSLTANIIWIRNVSIWEGIYIILLWGAITWILNFLSLKSITLRKVFEDQPTYLVKDGHIVETNLRRENLTLEDLTSMLRQMNNFSLADVELAILEINGSLSVQAKSDTQLVTRGDLQLDRKKLGIALPIVVDGVLLEHNLKSNHIASEWVYQILSEKQVKLEEVLYMELGINGEIKLERKESPEEEIPDE